MNIYVAGRTDERERVRRIQLACREAGHSISLDWTKLEGSDSGIQAASIAAAERAAVLSADLVVLCCSAVMLGAFIEVGMAMALRTPVWVLEPTRASVFWALTGVRTYADEPSLLVALREASARV